MRSHEESHCNDFQDHLHAVNQKENEINGSIVLGNTINFLVQGQEEAVNHNNEQDKSIEPRVDRYQLDDFVSEWVGHGKTT